MAATLSDLNAKPFQAAASAAETLIVDALPSEATLRLKFDHLVTIIIVLQTAPCTGSRDHPDENALRRLIRRAPNLQNLCIIQQIAPEDSEKASDRSLLGDRPGANIKYIPAHDLAAAFARSPQVFGRARLSLKRLWSCPTQLWQRGKAWAYAVLDFGADHLSFDRHGTGRLAIDCWASMRSVPGPDRPQVDLGSWRPASWRWRIFFQASGDNAFEQLKLGRLKESETRGKLRIRRS